MTAIFDMDGLLLDTEPLWGKSMLKIANHYQIPISPDHFRFTTGLRITEVTDYWSKEFPWPGNISSRQIADEILDDIIELSKTQGGIMEGVLDTLELLKSRNIKIGLATSSPMRMILELIPYFKLSDYFEVLISADTAVAGKPHPGVYLQCAQALHTESWNCVAFEDSVNGMIAAKAARMKVVVVPEAQKHTDVRFGLADLKLHSLKEFNWEIWKALEK